MRISLYAVLATLLVSILIPGLGFAFARGPDPGRGEYPEGLAVHFESMPERAKEVLADVFDVSLEASGHSVIDLGEVLVNGRRVQGIKIVDRPEAPGLEDNPGLEYGHRGPRGRGGGGGDKCFTTFGKGVSWKITEEYVLDTTNRNGGSTFRTVFQYVS